MRLNDLQKIILETANNKYPKAALIEIENDKILSLSEYDINDVIIALKDLQDNDLIKEAIIISVDQIVSFTGHLEITTKGRNFLKE